MIFILNGPFEILSATLWEEELKKKGNREEKEKKEWEEKNAMLTLTKSE